MNGWFDTQGFNTFYLNSSKYAKKNALLDSFYRAWLDQFGLQRSLSTGMNMTYFIKNNWKAAEKKKMKVVLQGQGYTPASIDALFKKFDTWNKSAPM